MNAGWYIVKLKNCIVQIKKNNKKKQKKTCMILNFCTLFNENYVKLDVSIAYNV